MLWRTADFRRRVRRLSGLRAARRQRTGQWSNWPSKIRVTEGEQGYEWSTAIGYKIQMLKMRLITPFLALAGMASGSVAFSDTGGPGGYNTYGFPGLIDMPSAWMPSDGELAFTSSYFANQARNTLTFQINPRLSGSFRYAQLYDVSPNADGEVVDFRFDRSFSLQYRVVDEGEFRPAVVIGLNDFLGTGFYRSEFIVASKQVTDEIRVTAGLGWGRLAGVGGFTNPLSVFGDRFDTREERSSSQGGELELSGIFTGDMALFGGVEWQATDRLRIIAEYSSDDYPNEDPYAFVQRSPINLGLSYDVSDNLRLSANYLYGSEVGVQLTYAVNPSNPPNGSGIEAAPLPVVPREALSAALSWNDSTAGQIRGTMAQVLEGQGMGLHSLRVAAGTARVEIENQDYIVFSQAIGRTARVLSRTMPQSVDQFEIIIVERGMPVTSITMARADVEDLEHDLDGVWSSLTRARLEDAAEPTQPDPGLYPRVDWGYAPYLVPSLFDPDNPFRADVGVDLFAGFEPAPGLIFSGVLRQKVLGNRDEADRESTSPLPRVRSESNLYGAAADTTIPRLTAAWYFRPGGDLFGRVTAGYLEPMFGGVSTEVLWRPNASRIAVGAELNYAVQRDYDQFFGLRDYDVVTGHVSGYWDIGNGFHTQLDLGRYLAGDWGATFALDREFENGWSVGVFATLTDVPFDEFGEGSFDKGIRLTIPISWASGQVTREATDLVIRPVWRDGGARLDVDGRLYDVVRPAQEADLADNWGRFWR